LAQEQYTRKDKWCSSQAPNKEPTFDLWRLLWQPAIITFKTLNFLTGGKEYLRHHFHDTSHSRKRKSTTSLPHHHTHRTMHHHRGWKQMKGLPTTAALS
jgi:hypothetical protein